VEVVAVEPLSEGTTRRLFPLKYQRVSTSGVTVNIAGPTDDLVIDLKSDGLPPSDAPTANTRGDRDPTKIR
jgi:hypothetical protein